MGDQRGDMATTQLSTGRRLGVGVFGGIALFVAIMGLVAFALAAVFLVDGDVQLTTFFLTAGVVFELLAVGLWQFVAAIRRSG